MKPSGSQSVCDLESDKPRESRGVRTAGTGIEPTCCLLSVCYFSVSSFLLTELSTSHCFSYQPAVAPVFYSDCKSFQLRTEYISIFSLCRRSPNQSNPFTSNSLVTANWMDSEEWDSHHDIPSPVHGKTEKQPLLRIRLHATTETESPSLHTYIWLKSLIISQMSISLYRQSPLLSAWSRMYYNVYLNS